MRPGDHAHARIRTILDKLDSFFITTRIHTILGSLVLSYIQVTNCLLIPSLSDYALPHSSPSPHFDYQLLIAACSAHGPPSAASPCITRHLLPSWSRLSIVVVYAAGQGPSLPIVVVCYSPLAAFVTASSDSAAGTRLLFRRADGLCTICLATACSVLRDHPSKCPCVKARHFTPTLTAPLSEFYSSCICLQLGVPRPVARSW